MQGQIVVDWRQCDVFLLPGLEEAAVRDTHCLVMCQVPRAL